MQIKAKLSDTDEVHAVLRHLDECIAKAEPVKGVFTATIRIRPANWAKTIVATVKERVAEAGWWIEATPAGSNAEEDVESFVFKVRRQESK